MSDLDGRAFVKRGRVLVPADFAADEMLDDLPEGREVLMTMRRPRSPQHHRFFFALLRKVVENTDRWASEEDLLDDLKIACGHATRRANLITGEISLVAKSINFASMPEDAFRRFKDRALFVLSTAIGVDPVTLMEEAEATQKPVGVASPSIVPQKTRSKRKQREPVDA